MFDSTKNIRMKIDASNLAIETCILQMHNEKWHSITYFSRKLTSVEQNYNIHDKKLLAIITTLKQWRVYTKEAFFLTIYTNHKNLITFITIKQLNRRQIKWLKLLDQYKLKIIYTSKKKNDRTDVMNRRSDYMRNKKVFNYSVFKINDDESLSSNKQKFNAMLHILRDDQKQYSIVKKKLQISKKDIDKCIKKYHDESLQKHFEVTKIMQLLRQHYQFSHMRQKVEIYIKKCFNC